MTRPTNFLVFALIAPWIACLAPAAGAEDMSPLTPMLLSPPDGSTCIASPVTLDWADVPGALSYEVQLGTECGVGGTIKLVKSENYYSSLEPGTTYFWRVRAKGAVLGPWSGCWSFSTPPAVPPSGTPVLTDPPDRETEMPTEITFKWECVPEAGSYMLRLGPNCGSLSYHASTACETTLSDLEPGTSYCWMVRAVGACGLRGSWSAPRHFKTAGYAPNSEGKWALHFAGQHGSKTQTQGLGTVGCDDIVVDGLPGPGRYDVYIIAVDVDAVCGTRFGLTCDGPVMFYGWTTAGRLEIPTEGWPGCGEGTAQVWCWEQPGPEVPIGVLDVYIYSSTNSLSVTADPRVNFAEWCDGSQPHPKCVKKFAGEVFGSVGFGMPGTNPCTTAPVGIADFAAQGADEGILLEWSSPEEARFREFYVHRSDGAWDGDYLRVSDDPVKGAGQGGVEYSYLDSGVIPGAMYYYKLEGIKLGGRSLFFGPYKAQATGVRPQYRLYQNAPNPFSRGTATEIRYSVASPCVVTMRIMDAAGRLVKTMTASAQSGDNFVTWDGTDDIGRQVASGVYFYEIRAEGFRAERKMMLVK